MPEELSLRGPVYTFEVYRPLEAKRLGLIDLLGKPGTHFPFSERFEHGEGKLLEKWINDNPGGILIATSRNQITHYMPKRRVTKTRQ